VAGAHDAAGPHESGTGDTGIRSQPPPWPVRWAGRRPFRQGLADTYRPRQNAPEAEVCRSGNRRGSGLARPPPPHPRKETASEAPDLATSRGRASPNSPRRPITCLRGIAQVYVPSEITGIGLRGKPYNEGSHVGARPPSSRAHELVKGFVQHGRVGRGAERDWLTAVPIVLGPDSHNRARPGCRIVCVTANRSPKSGETGVGDRTGKRVVNPKEAFLDKLVYLGSAQHAFCSMARRSRWRPSLHNDM
jgi:hypothetical protein